VVGEQDVLEPLAEGRLEADLGAVVSDKEGSEHEVTMEIASAGESGLRHARLEASVLLDLTHVVQDDAGEGEGGIYGRVERE
jgi:hypothetical protein